MTHDAFTVIPFSVLIGNDAPGRPGMSIAWPVGTGRGGYMRLCRENLDAIRAVGHAEKALVWCADHGQDTFEVERREDGWVIRGPAR